MFKNGIKCTLGVAAVATSCVASAIELTDYTNTDTAFQEAYVDLTANANAGNQDQESFSTNLDLNYDRRNSTADNVWGLTSSGYHSAARGPNDGDHTDSVYGLNLGINTDRYIRPEKDNLFWFGAASYAHQNEAVDDSIGVTVGLGYGRVWNATPLAKAIRIADKLSADGQLNGEVPDEVLLELAGVIAKESEYRSIHGPDTFKGAWYTDMESVLAGAGLLPTGDLSAYATVDLEDVLFNEPISARRHGWLVRFGAGFQSSDLTGLTDNDPKLLFQAEYAKPFGLKGQLINLFSFEPTFGDNTVARTRNALSYTYEISDRIDWINTWDLNLAQADDDDDSRFMTNTLATSFNYHLTNRLDVGIRLAAVDVNEKPNTNKDNDDVASSMNFGLRYRLK
ncbi:MAG: hypothetical protein CSB44_00205 [Gammaproteobacteria bacterium]|nr:MAG: hypothetical protein CSB44_00205 [Gammaproteobacteria bacterium]PIE38480.1 MAG: hypothetical protein CSA54_00200 [Gammaproteobacteria bacterium]